MNRDHIAGLGVGLLIGAAFAGSLALLYAPKKGSELRQDIRDKAEKTIGDVKAKFNRASLDDIKPR